MSDKSPPQNTRDNNKINRGKLIKSVQQINETKQKEQPSYEDGESNRERLLSLSINMIIISIVDLFFQSIFRLSQLAIADDVAIIITLVNKILWIILYNYNIYIKGLLFIKNYMAIFYLSSALKGKSVNHSWIIAPNGFIWFIGFIIRCFGIAQYKITICIIDFFLLFARGFILFFQFLGDSK